MLTILLYKDVTKITYRLDYIADGEVDSVEDQFLCINNLLNKPSDWCWDHHRIFNPSKKLELYLKLLEKQNKLEVQYR